MELRERIKGVNVRVGDTIRCENSGGLDVQVLATWADESGLWLDTERGELLVRYDETVIRTGHEDLAVMCF